MKLSSKVTNPCCTGSPPSLIPRTSEMNKLRTDPNFRQQELARPFLSSSTQVEALKIMGLLNKAFKGQSVTTGPSICNSDRQLFQGEFFQDLDQGITIEALNRLVELCKSTRTTKDLEKDRKPKGQKATAQKGDNKDLKGGARKSSRKRAGADYHCLYYGKNTSPDTEACKVLCGQVQKMTTAHGRINYAKKPKYTNQTRSCHDNQKKKENTQQMYEFVINMVKSAMKDSKKRKNPPTSDINAFNLEIDESFNEQPASKADSNSEGMEGQQAEDKKNASISLFSFSDIDNSDDFNQDPPQHFSSLDDCLDASTQDCMALSTSLLRTRPQKRQKNRTCSSNSFWSPKH